MNEKQLKKWEKNRRLGKRNFILKFGILYWGSSVALLYSVIMHFTHPMEPWYVTPITAIIVFPLGGILLGLFIWYNTEKKYLKLVKE